eukprot:2567351-Rhodomonas_salina.2
MALVACLSAFDLWRGQRDRRWAANHDVLAVVTRRSFGHGAPELALAPATRPPSPVPAATTTAVLAQEGSRVQPDTTSASVPQVAHATDLPPSEGCSRVVSGPDVVLSAARRFPCRL